MGQSGSGLWAGERDGLVGRDDALASVRDLLGSGSRTAVVTGIAGAGKTSVLEFVAKAAATDGCLVLPVTCHVNDRDLAFGVLVDLLMLAPGAEPVLEVILPNTAQPEAVDALRLRLDVLAWLEQLGGERAVVVVLDDAQWCDESSLSVLGFVSRRLTGSSVSVVAAVRGDAVPDSLGRSPVVALGALSDRDAMTMLQRSGVSIDFLTIPEVLQRAAGNPLALLELGRMAADGERQNVPSSVEAAFARQVAALPAPTRDVLLLAAAGDVDLAVLGRVVPPDQLLADLAPAEAVGLVAVVDRAVRFRHPLVRSAVYAAAQEVDRQSAHARLAAAYVDDAERRAWHRAEATVLPDDEVAAALALAAELAQRRGASSEAARLMVRASELSEVRAEREARLLQAVLIHGAAGHFEWAARVGSRLRVDAEDPWVRAYAAHYAAFSLAQTERLSAARRLLIEVLDQLRDADPFLGWSSLTTLAVLSYRAGWDAGEVEKWLAVYERATEQQSPGELSPMVPAARAWVRMQLDPTSRPTEFVALVHEAPVLATDVSELASANELLLGATAWLLDEPAVAVERLERAIAMKRAADRPGEMTPALSALALVQFAVGDYDAVDQTGRLALDIAEARHQRSAMIDAYEVQARVAAIRGDAERARELCNQILLEITMGETLALEVVVRVTMSWVRFAEHDVQGAWHEIGWIFDEEGAPRHQHISYRELGHYAATAVRAGATAELANVVAVAEQRLGDGAHHRLSLARAKALLAGDDAETWHRAAVDEPLARQWPFDLANARLEYGAWLRRRHRQVEARGQLQSALDTFARLGTRAWEELARSELRAAGVVTEAPEPQAWVHLTAQEREVVRMAASGLTNPEIAAALYLSPRTVSTHLHRAFPKLGVTSRGQLRDVMPEPT